MHTIDTDVLVVGAGPVGLSTAAELQRFGADCQVLEATAERAGGSRALTLHARTLELLHLRGVAEDFISQGRVVSEVMLAAGPRSQVRLDLASLDSPFPFVLILPQAETEQLLERQLTNLGGEVSRGQRVTGLELQNDHVIATVSAPDGGQTRWRAHWLVAADGARSTVRQLVGAKTRGDREGATYYGGDVSVEDMPAELKIIWSNGGFGALVPFADGSFRVAVTASGTVLHGSQPTLAQLQAQVDRVFPQRMRLNEPTWLTKLHSGHRQVLDYRHGRVFLAGDAAHTHNPAGGQGMNIGLHDSFNLGWMLAAVVHGKASEELLDTYHAERYPAAASVLAQTRRSMQLAHLKAKPLQMVRNTTLSVAPAAVRRRIAEQFAGLAAYDSRQDRGGWLSRSKNDTPTRVPDIPLMTNDGGHTSLYAEIPTTLYVELRRHGNQLTISSDGRETSLFDVRRTVASRLGLADGESLRIRPDGHVWQESFAVADSNPTTS